MISGSKEWIDAQEWLPQAPPFTFVDQFQIDDSGFEAAYTVKESAYLTRDGFLSPSALVENMAQTAAAENGWAAGEEGLPPPLGFLGSVSRLEVSRLPRLGERLRTRIRQTHQILQARVLHAEVRVGEEWIARCEMKIFLEKP